jgi:urease accessory protein
MRRAARILVAGLAAVPLLADAHGWGGKNTPIFDGFMHLATNPFYILPLLAVALFASRGGRAGLAQSQLLVAAAVALGAALALSGLAWTQVAIANRLYVIVTGLLVVLDLRLPRHAAPAVIVTGGLLCGYELLLSEPPAENTLLFCLGVVLGAMTVHGAAGALTLLSQAPWSRVAVRVAGSWITAIGVIYAGFLLLPSMK